MHIAQIRDRASKQILRDHPELEGLVVFDAAVTEVHLGMILVDLTVTLLGPDAWEKLPECAVRYDDGGRRMGKFEMLLDGYRSNDVEWDFVLDDTKFLIGDGDDWLGVMMDSSHKARIWVRAWEDQQ